LTNRSAAESVLATLRAMSDATIEAAQVIVDYVHSVLRGNEPMRRLARNALEVLEREMAAAIERLIATVVERVLEAALDMLIKT